MSHVKQFSDDTIAIALATLQANGGNAFKTSKQLGISRTTLRAWAGRAHSSTGNPMHPRMVKAELVKDKASELAQNLEDLAFQSVGLSREKADQASYKDLLIGSGIAIEKMLLLRGQATSRSESIQISLVSAHNLRDAALSVLGASEPLSISPVSIESEGRDRHP